MSPQHPQQPDPALAAFWDGLTEHLRTTLPPPLGKMPEELAHSQPPSSCWSGVWPRSMTPRPNWHPRYITTSVEAAYGLHYAGNYPRGSQLAMTLITQSARLRHKAQPIKSQLLTAQDERRRREATNVTALSTFRRPDGSPGSDADITAETAVAPALPARPPAPPEAARPEVTRPVQPRPALRLIQGGLTD